MRKLLLATVAVLGGSLALGGNAHAQLANTYTTAIPTPNPFTAAPAPVPGPGNISVRLQARIVAYMEAGSDSGRNATAVTGVAAIQPNTKLANYSLNEFTRFYPGFDGIAGNGLQYGAALEIRQDQAAPAGGGINGSISGDATARGALYLRREMAYVGADNYGFLRYGATDQPTSLFATGQFENFDDGAWNADLPNFFTANTRLTWPFFDQGGWYTTNKLVYLSPSFMGFDFGVSFEPNTGSLNNGDGNCAYNFTSSITGTTPAGTQTAIVGPLNGGNGSSCDAASATTTGDVSRRRNTVDAVLRYRGAFGPVGVAVTAGYIAGGRVVSDSLAAPSASNTYKNPDIYDFGGQVTFGGLAVGGHLSGGQYNGGVGLQRAGTKDALAYLVGTSYAFGPVIVGGSFFDYRSGGSKTYATPLMSNRNEYGIAAGGTYAFAPGMAVYLSYLYGHRYQGGFDFLAGAATGTTGGLHNNVQAQGVALGTSFRW
jgi:hypothetical protein